MIETVEIAHGRKASYEMVGEGRATLMFPGGPGFAAAYMRGDAELFSDTLQSFLIDPHGSGGSTPPTDTSGYSPEGHAAFYDEVRRALALDRVTILGHSFGRHDRPGLQRTLPGQGRRVRRHRTVRDRPRLGRCR